jgi:hypothetical protein
LVLNIGPFVSRSRVVRRNWVRQARSAHRLALCARLLPRAPDKSCGRHNVEARAKTPHPFCLGESPSPSAGRGDMRPNETLAPRAPRERVAAERPQCRYRRPTAGSVNPVTLSFASASCCSLIRTRAPNVAQAGRLVEFLESPRHDINHDVPTHGLCQHAEDVGRERTAQKALVVIGRDQDRG